MNQESASPVHVRPAQPADAPAIAGFIQPFVDGGKLLPSTSLELDALLVNYFVAERAGRIVACAALEIYSPKLAEVRSLAVDPSCQGTGIGGKLVAACVDLARQRNVLEVMAITSAEDFFKSCGFDFTLPGEKKALFIHTRDADGPGRECSST